MDQLEKNLAEAFAILDTMGVSNKVRHFFIFAYCVICVATIDILFVHMKPGMTKRGLRGASLDQLEKNLEEAFAILDSMGVSNVSGEIS